MDGKIDCGGGADTGFEVEVQCAPALIQQESTDLEAAATRWPICRLTSRTSVSDLDSLLSVPRETGDLDVAAASTHGLNRVQEQVTEDPLKKRSWHRHVDTTLQFHVKHNLLRPETAYRTV